MNKQIFIDKGRLITKDVPELTCRAGEIVVDVLFSAFSSGTEFGELFKSSQSLLARARKSPKKIGKAINMMKTTGIKNTINFVEDSQLALQATGYSLSGKVRSVGEGITDISVGDIVACSGAQYAHHATQVKVSKQLCTKVPDGMALNIASTVTLGAIAMQGIRQADICLGERVAVIGLGVIGQIASQILLAAGAVVTGFDLDERKLNLASENGVQRVLDAKSPNVVRSALESTDGHGFDKVLICASDPSSASANTAFEIARHRATVVMIGGIGLNLDRKLMYYKELNFVASMSYGPGRYERDYEEKGLDLPIAYVRWTENRNMLSYLEVVKNRSTNFENLIGHTIDFDVAEEYLNSAASKNLERPLIILKYKDIKENKTSIPAIKNSDNSVHSNSGIKNLAVIGAGGFSKNFILPNLNNNKKCKVSVLASSDNASVVNMKEKYDIEYGVSSINEALEHNVDALIVANRHSEHFAAIKETFISGKSIFIEKPTVNNRDDLNKLDDILSKQEFDNYILYTGYNRAFSPHVKFVKECITKVDAPIMMSYQMNAGLLKSNNWQYDIEEGGRNIGEAVHIYHLFGSLFNSSPRSLSVSCTRSCDPYLAYDNFSVTIKYENGCIGTLHYTSLGSDSYPKESFVIHSGGTTIVSENYTETQVVGGKAFKTRLPEKGHKEIIESFLKSLDTGDVEMTREEQLEVMRIAFHVENELREI
jgi:predicted dehydrogenase/threonine dehydrogenase-like Zn-dependent dehydrogenase